MTRSRYYEGIVAEVFAIEPEEVTREQRYLAKQVTFGARSRQERVELLSVFARLLKAHQEGATD